MKTNPARKRRWMIVDDEVGGASLIQTMLGFATGREVVCYNSGAEAFRAFQAEPDQFDLVITDFNMPRMNGDELRQRLRDLVPHLKIVMMTAHPDWDEALALDRGFDGFLAKPFSIAQVRDIGLSLFQEPRPRQAA